MLLFFSLNIGMEFCKAGIIFAYTYFFVCWASPRVGNPHGASVSWLCQSVCDCADAPHAVLTLFHGRERDDAHTRPRS
jgi:hypothetical protein